MTDSDDDEDESGARADGGGDDYDEEEEEEEEDLYTYARREMERIEAARKARKATPPVRGEKPSAPRYDMDYNAAHPLVRQVLKMIIWGIPLAVGPLLQLATAQAGTCNSQKKT